MLSENSYSPNDTYSLFTTLAHPTWAGNDIKASLGKWELMDDIEIIESIVLQHVSYSNQRKSFTSTIDFAFSSP